MKTDKQLYNLFRLVPKYLFELMNISVSAKYKLTSETIKEFSRSMDGLMKPDISGEPYYVIEFQMQQDTDIYYRIIMEMAALGVHHKKNIYHGIIIFKNKTVASSCKSEPWASMFQNNVPALRVFYFDEMLKELKKCDPEHPILLVFYPYLEENDTVLEKNAIAYYNKLKQSDMPKELIMGLLDIFLSWLAVRFKNKNNKEILTMLALTTSFEETKFYKEILAIGKEEGIEEGVEEGKKEGKKEGKIEIAKALLGILDIKIISEKIGLSVKDIKKLSV